MSRCTTVVSVMILLLLAGSAFSLPFYDGFENGLTNWTQVGDPGNDAVIVTNPYHKQGHAVGMWANAGIPPYQEDNSQIAYSFDPVNGVTVETWFYITAYGMGDNPASWGAGRAGHVMIRSTDAIWANVYVNHDGHVRYDLPGNQYIVLDPSVTLDLNQWYKYLITYQDGEMHVVVRDASFNLIMDAYADGIADFSPNQVTLGSFCMNNGYSYFDDFAVYEFAPNSLPFTEDWEDGDYTDNPHWEYYYPYDGGTWEVVDGIGRNGGYAYRSYCNASPGDGTTLYSPVSLPEEFEVSYWIHKRVQTFSILDFCFSEGMPNYFTQNKGVRTIINYHNMDGHWYLMLGWQGNMTVNDPITYPDRWVNVRMARHSDGTWDVTWDYLGEYEHTATITDHFADLDNIFVSHTPGGYYGNLGGYLLDDLVIADEIQGYEDNFDSDLSEWTPRTGSWDISQDGKLHGFWTLTSAYGAQGTITLNDEHQIEDNWQASVRFTNVDDDQQPSHNSAEASFLIWMDGNNYFRTSVGGSGWNDWGGPQTIITGQVQARLNGTWQNAPENRPYYEWDPDIWHTAYFEKHGNWYYIGIDKPDEYIFAFEDTYFNGEGVLGMHTYGTKYYDDFALVPDETIPLPYGPRMVVINTQVDGELDEILFDNNNIAGMADDATDGYDIGTDIYEPPHAPNNYITTYFPHDEWNAPGGDNFMRDIKLFEDLTNDRKVYPIEVLTDELGGAVDMDFSIEYGIPETWGVVLYDVTSDIYQNLREDNAYSFIAPDDAYQLELAIGDATDPVVAITSPTADEVLNANNDQEITWTIADITAIRSVVLEVSLDNGANWTELAAFDDDPGTWTWTPPYQYEPDAVVRVTAEDWAGNAGSASQAFILNDPDSPYITLISPALDDVLHANSTETLEWEYTVIPGNDVQTAVLSYSLDDGNTWVVITDQLGTATSYDWDIPLSVYSQNARIKVEATDLSGQTQSGMSDRFMIYGPMEYEFTEGWHLTSFNCLLDPPTPDDQIGDDILTGYYALYGFGDYGYVYDPDTLHIGEGDWLYMEGTGTTTVDMVGDYLTDSLVIPLREGWTLAGLGMPGAIDWDFCRVTDGTQWLSLQEAEDAHWISYPLFAYDDVADDYTVDHTHMLPFSGYWMLAFDPGYSLVQYDADPAPAGPAQAPDGELDELPLSWFVTLTLDRGDKVSTLAGFGAHEWAEDDYDAEDLVLPPASPSGNILRAYTHHANWGIEQADDFCKDVRGWFADNNETEQWRFVVESSEAGDILITAEGILEALPEGYTATAFVQGETYNLLESPSFTVNHNGHGQIHVEIEVSSPFLNVADQEFQGMPEDWSIAAAYPNPFNPTLHAVVGLPATSELTVVVYDVLGREITTLHQGVMNAGYHAFVFDGSQMASGMYFLRASVPGKMNDIRQVVLVK